MFKRELDRDTLKRKIRLDEEKIRLNAEGISKDLKDELNKKEYIRRD